MKSVSLMKFEQKKGTKVEIKRMKHKITERMLR